MISEHTRLKLAGMRFQDLIRENGERNEREQRMDSKDYRTIRPTGKHQAKSGRGLIRHLKNRQYAGGATLEINVGTPVGVEIAGKIYGERHIMVSTGCTWIRKGIK